MLNIKLKHRPIKLYLLFALVITIVNSCFSPYFEVWDHDIEISYTILDSTSVRLRWVDHIGYDNGYHIEKMKSGGQYQEIKSFSNSTFATTDTVTLDSTYYYRCYTIINDTTIIYSNEIKVFILRDFYKSMTLYSEVLDSSTIKLTWDENFDHPATLFLKTSMGNGSFSLLADFTTNKTYYIHNNVTPYVKISYKIKPSIQGRDLAYSNTVTIEPRKTFSLEELNIQLIPVEGDSFSMGNVWDEGINSEKPVHRVFVNDFYMGIYEINEKQFSAITMSNHSPTNYHPNYPARSVTFYEAINFCNSLSALAGYEEAYTIEKIDGKTKVSWDPDKNGYRLPTEAEWEYAARTKGRDDRKYVGTNHEYAVKVYSWFSFNSEGKPHEVGLKNPTQLGLYDMGGNVNEWCWDAYSYNYYDSSPSDNPKGPDITFPSTRVLRGGSYKDNYTRTSTRFHAGTTVENSKFGFRICRNAE